MLNKITDRDLVDQDLHFYTLPGEHMPMNIRNMGLSPPKIPACSSDLPRQATNAAFTH